MEHYGAYGQKDLLRVIKSPLQSSPFQSLPIHTDRSRFIKSVGVVGSSSTRSQFNSTRRKSYLTTALFDILSIHAMNESQRQSLLEAIAISSGILGSNITPQQRTNAFTNLEQFKTYPQRVSACVDMIGCNTLQIAGTGSGNAPIDVTVPGKLYALGVIQEFLKVGYNSLNESDRTQLRTSILTAARQLAMSTSASDVSSIKMNDSTRILAVKIGSLLADLALREFPQRWQTFVSDLFSLWGADASGNNTTGVKICLECLKLITEDCTDSDYNARVRRSSGFTV